MGDLTASSNTACAMGVALTNNTGSNLTSFTVSYVGEQWRAGGNATPRANALTFKYATGTAATISDITSPPSFSTQAALNFISPQSVVTTIVLDGNAVAIQVAKSYLSSGIKWNAGDKLMLRWDDANLGGTNNTMAIDNFYFQAFATSNTYQWNGATTDYTSASNWTPTRTTPSNNDVLQVLAGFTFCVTVFGGQNYIVGKQKFLCRQVVTVFSASSF